MPLDGRVKLVADNKLCVNCLLPNHDAQACRKPFLCNVNNCRQKHSRYLHRDTLNIAESSNAIANFDVHEKCHNIMMPIVPIIVNNCYHTYALLDTGSSHTFCTRRLVNALDLDGIQTSYDLKTLTGAENRSTIEVNLSLEPKDHSESFHLQKVLVIDSIPVHTTNADLSRYDHMKDLTYPDAATVDVIIGQNYSDLLYIHESRRGKPGDPYAARTVLGWSFHGPASPNVAHSTVTSHLISAIHGGVTIDKLREVEQDGLLADTCKVSKDNPDASIVHNSSAFDDGHVSLHVPSRQHDVLQFTTNDYVEPTPMAPEATTSTRCLTNHDVPMDIEQLYPVLQVACSAKCTDITINYEGIQHPTFTCESACASQQPARHTCSSATNRHEKDDFLTSYHSDDHLAYYVNYVKDVNFAQTGFKYSTTFIELPEVPVPIPVPVPKDQCAWRPN